MMDKHSYCFINRDLLLELIKPVNTDIQRFLYNVIPDTFITSFASREWRQFRFKVWGEGGGAKQTFSGAIPEMDEL